MPAAFIEHRPYGSSEDSPDSHYVIFVDGVDIDSFFTKSAAKNFACQEEYRPVHVARVRHLPDRRNPDH